MFTYNKTLTYDNQPITSNDTILVLKNLRDPATFFGIFMVANHVVGTVQFVGFEDSIYKARFTITEENASYLQKNVTFHLQVSSQTFQATTNTVPILFNWDKIRLTIKSTLHKELLELKDRLTKLEQNHTTRDTHKVIAASYKSPVFLTGGKPLLPGMVPVAISDHEMVPAFPFTTAVQELNGIIPLMGKIILTAEKIPVTEEQSVLDCLRSLEQQVENLSVAVSYVTEGNRQILKRLSELETAFAEHKNSGIL